jgi:hypothetical protein
VVGNPEVTARSRRLDANSIINRSPDALFAAEIAFGCLYGNVPEQELNLLQIATGRVAQSQCWGSPHVGLQAMMSPIVSVRFLLALERRACRRV